MAIGVDVGGTFTDLALRDGSGVRIAKVPTTPDESQGVVEGAVVLTGGDAVDGFLHGTTVATNALLERRGADVALVASAGFGDVIEIGRQDRPSLYDSAVVRPAPLVAAARRFETGADLAALCRAVAAVDPGAVAVSLLDSYADPGEERRVAEALRAALPGLPVSASADVVAEFREYERTSTTVLNAYLTPAMGRYLQRLQQRVADAGLSDEVTVMRSSGGLIPAGRAAALPVAVLLSGPAAGVVAVAEMSRAMGLAHVVSFDMGGTSTDVCRIDDALPTVTYERAIDGFPCRMPAVAIHTVGAGGGSVAWADAGGALRVGPRSAGAHPGPACYGRGGTQPAVTDADLLLGRLAGDARLGGSVALRPELARAAIARLGEGFGLDPEETAAGIVAVVEAHMARAVRTVSVGEGSDPRAAWLVAFGGAGGMHATALARSLDMAGVVVPPFAGVFSAVGLLLSPPRADAARTILVEQEDAARLDEVVAGVASAAAEELRRAAGSVPARITTLVDARYRGQSHETIVPYRAGEGWNVLEERFHRAHRERNGFARPGDPVEAVTVRAEAVGAPGLRWDDLPPPRPEGEARRGGRAIVGPDGAARAEVWWRPGLAPGDTVAGPAVIEDLDATTFLAAGERAVVDDGGALVVEW